MRVAIFTESFTPLINGVSTSVETLLAELERRGHTTYVVTSGYPKFVDSRPGIFRFPSINSLVEPDYRVPIPISPRIAAEVARLRLDVVHSQSPFLFGLMARRIARRYGIPLVSTNHTLYTEYLHYLPFIPRAFARSVAIRHMNRYYNSCDAVITPSEYTRGIVRRDYGVTAPITVVPTGVPASPYVLASRAGVLKTLGLPARARVLLYVGRLAREKNLDMLLQAFRMLRQDAPDAHLVLAGSGNNGDRLRALALEMGLAEHAHFIGFVDRTRLDPLYKAADVFVFPSGTETQGLAVAEAMSAGTPCVVVNGGGAAEAVTDGVDGFVIPSDAAVFARRTLQLLADPDLRRRMGEAARCGSERLRPERMAEEVIKVYERVIAGDAASEPDLGAMPIARDSHGDNS